jgi:integrase
MPYLQLVDGAFRVRIVVPPKLQSHLPPPHTGKASLTKALATGNKAEANRLAVPWIADFQATLNEAQAALRGEDGWKRYTYYPGPYEGSFGGPRIVRCHELPPDHQINRYGEAIVLGDGHPLKAKTAGPPISFDSMIDKWAKFTNAPKKGIQDKITKCGEFTTWLRTNNPQAADDMRQVTFENGRDYRDFLIDEDRLARPTIANHLKALSALFKHGFENYPDDFPVNPMTRVKFDPGDGEARDDFTPDERARILIAAREAEPHIHWLNWLSSFNGGRLSELAEADTRDIVTKEGVWVMEIKKTIRVPDQRRKTRVSSRDAPLHSALLAEGLLDYREGIISEYGDGPLFPQIPLDAYGRRNGVSSPISKWLRNFVGIKDPRKPFHSHRHTATSYLRNTRLPDGEYAVKTDIERYLLGHSEKDSHAGYGKQWIETLKAAIELIPDPLHAVKDGASAGC